MIRWITRLACVAAAFLLGASGAAAADAYDLAQVKARGQIRVALYKDFAPFSDDEKGGAGVDVDVARLLAEKLGVKLQAL